MADNKFSINSEKYELMKEEMINVSQYIKKSIINKTPIIIRHHNDPDGICAGIALELACIRVMEKNNIKSYIYLQRNLCRAPFYDFPDFLKDLSSAKRYEEKGNKKPLVIILDNGSTPQDLFSIKCLFDSGINAIVIDHHDPVIIDEDNKTTVCPYLKYHVNPHLKGLDSQLSAGMIAFEISCLLDPDYAGFNNYILPAIAGVDDRSESKEIEEYINKSNLSKDRLKKIGAVIDYTVFKLKMDLKFGVFVEIINNENLIDTVFDELSREVNTTILEVKKRITKHGEFSKYDLYSISLENNFDRFLYPRAGKIAGIMKDELSKTKDVVLILYLEDVIIVRQTETIVSIQDIVLSLKKRFPDANVLGGGHARAGSIKFLKSYFEEIKEEIIKIFS